MNDQFRAKGEGGVDNKNLDASASSGEDALDGKPSELPSALVESYKQFTSFHSTQETLFWTRNNLLVLMQVGLMAALFSLLGRKQPDEWHLIPVGAFGISAVGIGLTVAWIIMVERSRYLFDVALSILAETEQKLLQSRKLGLFTLFYIGSKTVKDDKTVEDLPDRIEGRLNRGFAVRGRALRLSTIWIRVGWGFAAVWAFALVVDIFYVACGLSPCGSPLVCLNQWL